MAVTVRLRQSWPLVRDYVHTSWIELVLSVAGLLGGIVLSRAFGPTVRGEYAAATLWPGLLAVLVGLGLHHSCAYAAASGSATPSALLRFGTCYAALVGVPAAAIYGIVCPTILSNAFKEVPLAAKLFALSIPVTLLGGLLLPILQGAHEFAAWNKIRAIRGLSWVVAVILLAGAQQTSTSGLLHAQLLIMVLVAGLAARSVGSIADARDPGEVNKAALFRYGGAVYLSGLTYLLNQQLDQLVLSLTVPIAELGQYAAAVSLSSLLLIVPQMLGPVLFTKLARAKGAPDGVRPPVRPVLGAMLGLLALPTLLLTAFGVSIATLVYGSQFAIAGHLLSILAPAAMLLAITNLFADAVRGVGKPMYAAYAAGAGAAVTLPGLYLLVPKIGIYGAAYVSLAAYLVMALVEIVLYMRWSRVHG